MIASCSDGEKDRSIQNLDCQLTVLKVDFQTDTFKEETTMT